MKNFLYVLKIMLPLVLICAVTVGLLALVNSFTAPVIAENQKKVQQQNMAALFGEGIDAPVEISVGTPGVKKALKITKDNNLVGYCFDATANGYNGAIEVLIAMDGEGKIIGIKRVADEETTTYGRAKVLQNEQYLALYNGRTAENYGAVEFASGATYTSEGLQNAVKNAFEAYKAVAAEGGAAQ